MGKVIVVYGIIAGVMVAALMQLSIHLVPEGGTLGMIVGFGSMIVALSFVFIGVKRYRDVDLGGVIGFWRALGVGFAISVIAAAFYVIGWEIYLYSTDYTFIDKLSQSELEKAQKLGKSAADIAAIKAQLAMYKEWYASPLTRMAVTAMEISPIAIPMPIISASLLCFSKVLPAHQPRPGVA